MTEGSTLDLAPLITLLRRTVEVTEGPGITVHKDTARDMIRLLHELHAYRQQDEAVRALEARVRAMEEALDTAEPETAEPEDDLDRLMQRAEEIAATRTDTPWHNIDGRLQEEILEQARRGLGMPSEVEIKARRISGAHTDHEWNALPTELRNNYLKRAQRELSGIGKRARRARS